STNSTWPGSARLSAPMSRTAHAKKRRRSVARGMIHFHQVVVDGFRNSDDLPRVAGGHSDSFRHAQRSVATGDKQAADIVGAADAKKSFETRVIDIGARSAQRGSGHSRDRLDRLCTLCVEIDELPL